MNHRMNVKTVMSSHVLDGLSGHRGDFVRKTAVEVCKHEIEHVSVDFMAKLDAMMGPTLESNSAILRCVLSGNRGELGRDAVLNAERVIEHVRERVFREMLDHLVVWVAPYKRKNVYVDDVHSGLNGVHSVTVLKPVGVECNIETGDVSMVLLEDLVVKVLVVRLLLVA